MLSTMMTSPLTITSLMKHVEKINGDSEVVSITADNERHRYTYREAFVRVRQLANGLKSLGAKHGDCIGTLAWNDYRHFELYYAVSCSGMVCHTVNPRLFPEQIEFIVNHAEDQWLFIDPMFVPLLEKVQDKLHGVKGYIVLSDEGHMPVDSSLRNIQCYETLISKESDSFVWPDLDENTASSMCYTSGTTGDPKGVVYSHRSTILHVYASALPDSFDLSGRDVIMPIVPMFHVNGWGLVYSVPMVGAKLVLPGSHMANGESLTKLIREEGVTASAGVPTVWLALLQYLEKSGEKVESLNRLISGGAACPQSIFEGFSKYEVEVQQAWGMTETSPLGTYNIPQPYEVGLSSEEFMKNRLKQGRIIYGLEMCVEDDSGNELPWDGESSGSVKVRGPWVTASYYKQDVDPLDKDGWFETGDVANINPHGVMQITDRTKDVIKSGGEWISSIELENCAVDHPAVFEAAVIGIPHPKWTERPLLLAIVKDGESVTREEMLAWFEGKVAKWCIPEDCVFVETLAHTATGKLSKKDIRKAYSEFQWSDSTAGSVV